MTLPSNLLTELVSRRPVWALLSGLVLAGAFPPWDLWPLALAGLIPLIIICYEKRPLAAAGSGLAFGIGLGLAQFYWIVYALTVYGGLPWTLSWVILLGMQTFLALYIAGFAAMVSGLRLLGISPILAAPLAWAGTEWLRGWLFSGFPWLPLSGSLSVAAPLVQSAELWGSTGLSALVVLINALLARAALVNYKKRGWAGREFAAVGAAVIILVGGWAWGHMRMGQVRRQMAEAPRFTVSVIQPNIELKRLWAKGLRMKNVGEQLRLTVQAAQAEPRPRAPWLALWAESSAPFYFMHDARPTMAVMEAARETGAYIMVGSLGSLRYEGKVKPTNRTWLVGPGGKAEGYYDKVHLVPFGEYVPLGEYLPFVKALAAASGDYAPGKQGRILAVGPVKTAPLICYESIFPDLARSQRLRGGGTVAEPDQ